MAAFHKNQMVKAGSSTQGMKAGATYRVTEVDEWFTPFGVYTTYTLQDAVGDKLVVRNLHLLASPVKEN